MANTLFSSTGRMVEARRAMMIASFYNAETEKHISDAQIEVVPRVGDLVNGIWIVTQVEHTIRMGLGETSGHDVVVHMMRLP